MKNKTTNLRAIYPALLALLLLTFLAAPLFPDADNPPARVGRLSYLQGKVSFQPAGESQWSEASLNYPVTTGDRLYTDQGSRAEIESGPFAVHLSETTDLTMANLNDQVMQLGLAQGTIGVSVFQIPSGNSVEVDTPNGALLLLSPGSYRIETYPDEGSTLVIVKSGSLQVTGGGANQMVQAGQAVKLSGTGPIQISFVSPSGPDGFDQWCATRDQRIQSFAYSQDVNHDVPGVEDLGGYGRWETVAPYGPVWYPGGVPGDWVPYRYGRWVWVSPWGWTWVESEPWGYAPFHYGRWAYVGSAWCWVPGPVAFAPVYAPALVAFAGGAGFFVGVSLAAPVGWFPLGPREPFFPWYHYGGNYLRQVNITNIRNVTNITNIINVRNTSQIHYANQRLAMTAVPAAAFRGGQPVAAHMVRVTPQQVARAQVIPHPSVTPTAPAVFGGRRVAAPPVRAERATIARGVPPAPSRAPARTQSARPPLISRNAAPSRAPARAQTARPPLITRNAAPSRSVVVGPPRAAPRLITRNPLPPRSLPFSVRQPAMAQHPGRPLEPQQRANLRAGKPAGPTRDREFPAHPKSALRANPSPSKPAPAKSKGKSRQ